MKTAYVTGATGCVGRNLLEALLDNGEWRIVAFHRKSSDLSAIKTYPVDFKEVDLYDLDSVRSVLPDEIDAIFHVAGNTSYWAAEAEKQWKDNVLATRNLAQAALEKRTRRFIFTSTGATIPFQSYDTARAEKIHENYIRTKRLSEIEIEIAMGRGLDAVFLHPIIVIGAYDLNSYSSIFTMMKNNFLKLAFPGRIAFCRARDVALAHINAFQAGKRGEHYLLGGDYATWKEMFEKIARRFDPKARVFVPPVWALYVAAFFISIASRVTGKKPLITPSLVSLLHDAPDVEAVEKRKAEKDLSYLGSSLDDMLEDCYRWLKQEEIV